MIAAFQRLQSNALESTIAARAKENQVERKGEQSGATLTTLSNLIEPVNTRAEVAKIANVSEGTIAKVKTIKANASEETKEKFIIALGTRLTRFTCRTRQRWQRGRRGHRDAMVGHFSTRQVYHAEG